MKNVKTLWEQGSMSTTIEDTPSDQMVEHMESTVVGTPGGIRYQHITAIDKLKAITNCYFLLLKRSGRILGSIAYHLRKTRTGDLDYKTWYVRYFSINAPLRNTKKYRKNNKRPVEERSSSLLKDITHLIHDNPERLLDVDTKEVPKAVLYATIEAANERSKNFAAIGGYERITDVHTIIFSRLRKRSSAGIEKLQESELLQMRKTLSVFYGDYALYTDEYVFLNEDYYVLKKDGEVVAGVQANDEMWRVRSIGNKSVDWLIRSLTRTGYVKRRFTYEQMRFLGIEGIYYREGMELEFYRLLEGVLSLKNHHLAMMVLDGKSPEYNMLMKHGRLGPLHRFLGTFRVYLFAKFFSFTADEKADFIRRPVYLPIYDST